MGVSPPPGARSLQKVYWGKEEAGSCQTAGPEVRLGSPASPSTRGIVWASPLVTGPLPASQQEAISPKKMKTSLQGHRVSLKCGDRCGVSVPLDPDRTWDNCGHRPLLTSWLVDFIAEFISQSCTTQGAAGYSVEMPEGTSMTMRPQIKVFHLNHSDTQEGDGGSAWHGQESKAVDRRNQRPRIPKMEGYPSVDKGA